MTAEPRPRSLLWRTTAILASAFLLAAIGLFVALRPILSGAYEQETRALLAEREARENDLHEGDATSQLVLQAATRRDFELAQAAVADAPLDLVLEDPKDAEAVRRVIGGRLGEHEAARVGAIRALGSEVDDRRRERLSADWVDARERSAVRARHFGGAVAARTVAGVFAILGVLFLVHGWLLWKWVLDPVRRLASATDELSRGRLSARIEVRGDDEVARLGRGFNAMATNLEKALDDLRALNATLEDRVRAKSAEIEAKERALRQADKMASLGTLAGGVAHEFNNLLGGIQGCAEDASRESDPAELRATLGMIERTARRGTAITNNLLRFARPSEGARRRTEVASVVKDVVQLIEPEAVRTGVSVTAECSPGCTVVADGAGLHQVLLNLCTNALHAMKAQGGGSLTIRAEGGGGAGGEVRISVADTGPGVAPEHRERLFEPFFTTRAEGTGLGLSVSWGIVSSHGGRIDADSVPGRGATFTVVLPGGVDG